MSSSSALFRIAKALDSRNIGEVLVALETLEDDVEEVADTLELFLEEVTSWDLLEDQEVAEAVIRRLLECMEDDVLHEICVNLLKNQTVVALPIAVEVMMTKNWKLSIEDCREVYNKIEVTKPNVNFRNTFKKAGLGINKKWLKAAEYVKRVTANSQILRVSGAPANLLKEMLIWALLPLQHLSTPLPPSFVNELAIFAPYHPVVDVLDSKNNPDTFLVPLCVSPNFRLRAQIDDYIAYFSGFYHKERSREFFRVLVRICERMEHADFLEAQDIDLIIKFWMITFKLLSGNGIDMDQIRQAAKLIENTTARFELERRPLFLKRFLKKIADNKNGAIAMEPQIVAVIITTFQREMCSKNSPEFFNELGEFYTYFNELKYNDVYNATAFYSAVFAIAQAQALFKINKPLCQAVYETILKPMHLQIADFQQKQELKKKREDNMSNEEKMEMEREELGADVFTILICTYQRAEEAILKFTTTS